MFCFQEDLDCERVQGLLDHIEQSIIKIYRWAFENCEYPMVPESGDCPGWVFNKIREMYEEISEIQEIVREWDE